MSFRYLGMGGWGGEVVRSLLYSQANGVAARPTSFFQLQPARSLAPPEQAIEKRPCHHRQLQSRRIDGIPVAQDGKTLDVEHGELAGQVEREGVAEEGGGWCLFRRRALDRDARE